MEDVRFGSLADICSAQAHVRFTPNSDRESGFPQTAMSALLPKADLCGANRNVRFGPIADITNFQVTAFASGNFHVPLSISARGR